MIKTTIKISGMACSMCEAHINSAIRTALPVRKVSSSHTKGESVILSDAPLNTEKLKQAINASGYTFVSLSEETAEKKGFLSGLVKRKYTSYT